MRYCDKGRERMFFFLNGEKSETGEENKGEEDADRCVVYLCWPSSSGSRFDGLSRLSYAIAATQAFFANSPWRRLKISETTLIP